jgi:hypothetical protein
VLRPLDNPSKRELRELREQSNGRAVAALLLTLPAYFTGVDSDGDEADAND